MYCVCVYGLYVCTYCSRMAQWKRAGPITQIKTTSCLKLSLRFFYQVFVPPPLIWGQKKFQKLRFGEKNRGDNFGNESLPPFRSLTYSTCIKSRCKNCPSPPPPWFL